MIKIEGVGKRYTIGKQQNGSLRSSLGGILKSAAGKGEDFWALRNISFEVKKGEVLGVIGKNGAGKSTLLKILSKITKPTEGRIEIDGRVASLLEVGTGFHPELTGRENIYLNGTILGMSRKEVKAKFDEIVEFSGIEKFIDTAVKHYSSGMYVRLAFAVAAHLEPDILIIDEVLAVGDAEFQRKCLGKMQDVAEHGRTVIFVSHNMSAMQNFCTKGIVIESGKVIHDGDFNKAVELYSFGNDNNSGLDLKSYPRTSKKSDDFTYTKLNVIGPSTGSPFLPDDKIKLQLTFENKASIKQLAVGFSISDSEGRVLIECRSFKKMYKFDLTEIGEHLIEVEFIPSLNAGTYSINLGAVGLQGDLDYIKSAYLLEIRNKESEESWYSEDAGQFIVEHDWKFVK